MKDNSEELKQAFKIIQTQIVELQESMNKMADVILELTKYIIDVQNSIK